MLAEISSGLVKAGSVWVHRILAVSDAARESGVWIAEDSEAEAIGTPLAAIAARRGAPGGVASPDVADLIAAGVALAAYVLRSAILALDIRRATRRARRDGTMLVPEPAEDPAA